MNRILALFAAVLSPLILSCGVGRSLVIPSEFAIGNERYHVDTLKQRWGRVGDAPERTCLHFRNVRNTIVGTDKARAVRRDTNYSDFLIRRDTLANGLIEEEYIVVNPYYYSENTLLEEMPNAALYQALNALSDGVSPATRKRMAENHTLFCVELLVGKDGYVLESSQYIFMDSLKINKELLDFCAKVDHSFNHFPYRFNGSIWMKENNIPYGPIRTFFLMIEEGTVHPTPTQLTKFFEESRERW